ncbi:unnamed protein product [Closterium sp. Naga37s-1]|nr:unnamed protein product [Closterium sp. Naga37s-1]
MRWDKWSVCARRGTFAAINGSGAVINGSGAVINGSGAAINGSGAVINGSGAAINGSGAAINGSGAAINGSGAATPGKRGRGDPPHSTSPHPLSPCGSDGELVQLCLEVHVQLPLEEHHEWFCEQREGGEIHQHSAH